MEETVLITRDVKKVQTREKRFANAKELFEQLTTLLAGIEPSVYQQVVAEVQLIYTYVEKGIPFKTIKQTEATTTISRGTQTIKEITAERVSSNGILPEPETAIAVSAKSVPYVVATKGMERGRKRLPASQKGQTFYGKSITSQVTPDGNIADPNKGEEKASPVPKRTKFRFDGKTFLTFESQVSPQQSRLLAPNTDDDDSTNEDDAHNPDNQ